MKDKQNQFLLSLFGYGLLAIALVDCLHIVTPLRFTNPAWELHTIGLLVEHSTLLLIGLTLVFYRHEEHIKELEKILLGFLSWISLLLGILYLLMIPLGVADTWRLHHFINAQITTQLFQQSQPLQSVKEQLKQANTDEQLKKLIVSPAPQNGSQEIKNLQLLKKQFLAQIPQAELTHKVQAESMRTSQEHLLLKNSVKWHLGALVVGTLLILFWHLTDWARTP